MARILVVDDSALSRRVSRRILEGAGHAVADVADGLTALERYALDRPDLVLLDVTMAEMDGLEATRIIRNSNGPQPAIVAMTANAMVGDKEECLAVGMNDYLSKPVNLEELISILEKWGGLINADPARTRLHNASPVARK